MIGLRALQAASWTDSDLSHYKSVKMTFEYEKLDFFFSYQKHDYNCNYWMGVVLMFSEDFIHVSTD